MKILKKIMQPHIIILFILCSIVIYSVWYMYDIFHWNVAAKYEEYAKEFNIVKDYIAEMYPNEENKGLWVGYDKENNLHYFEDCDTQHILECSNEVEDALETVCNNAFPEKHLYYIRITGNRISFVMDGLYSSLTYSPDGKPEDVSGIEKEDYDVDVKRADDDWYHVRK